MRAKRHQFEWNLLVLVTAALVLFGLVMVYSATSGSAALGNANPLGFVEKQADLRAPSASRCSWSSRALRLRAASSACADPRRDGARPLRRRAGGGTRVNGARRWIDVGPLVFQPSELAKLAVVVWTAAYSRAARRRAR